LGREYFHYDAQTNTLMGSDTGLFIKLGQRVTVRLTEAEPVAGGIAFELLSIEDTALPKGPRKFSKGAKRKLTKHKRKTDKIKRQVKRKAR
jgi:ribonuclease R